MFFFASRADHQWFDNQPVLGADLEDPRHSVLVGDSVQVDFLVRDADAFDIPEYQDCDIRIQEVMDDQPAAKKRFRLSIPFVVGHREYIIYEDKDIPGYLRGTECFITLEAASDVAEKALLRLLDERDSKNDIVP